MPATLPSHQAAVLPLKLWRPHRFDGVALAVGAATPDAAYVLTGLGPTLPGHSWHALFWFNPPLTFALSALLRRAAPAVVANLPVGRRALGDYAVLATVRHPLRVTAYSALLGALSHLLWDAVTHPYLLIGHPFLADDAHLPALHAVAFGGLAWWRVIHLASELVGVAGAAAMLVLIGRRRLLTAWHGPAPAGPRRPALFWAVAALTSAALFAVIPALPHNGLLHVIASRLLGAVVAGLLVAAGTVTALTGATSIGAGTGGR